MQEYASVYPPDYVIKSYTKSIYGVCRFKRCGESFYIGRREEAKTYDSKLDNNFSRARSMVLQYGLCNRWDYFATITLDEKKYDRYDLDVFLDDFSQHIRDLRKDYKKHCDHVDVGRLSFVVVPETHKNGAWHLHGLLAGIPSSRLSRFEAGKHPRKLVDSDYLNWLDCAEKFGFCSLGPIRDQYSTVLYTVKYINKAVRELADMKGKHLYRASRPLKTAVKVSEVYGPDWELDSCLDWHGPFCSTGMVTGKDWSFVIDHGETVNDEWMLPVKHWEPDPEPLPFDPVTIDPTVQMTIDELMIGA